MGTQIGMFSRFSGALLLVCSVAPAADVLTYHNDNERSGLNSQELILTPSTVSNSTFGLLLTIPVDGAVDAQPLYVSGVVIPNQGAHNVLLVATEHDSVYAFDADTGTTLWQKTLLLGTETTSDDRGCGQVSPEIGVTATPVIDPSAGPNGAVYVVAMSKSASSYFQRMHALDLTTGAELFGGPANITGVSVPGSGPANTFLPAQYKERPGLVLLNGVVYTTWSSHCDIKPYSGWVIGFDQRTLAIKTILNLNPNGSPPSSFLPDGSGNALWNSGAAPAADPAGNIYTLVGNGPFDSNLTGSGFPANGDFGDAFVKMSTGSGLAVADYFSPSTEASLAAGDTDLGSGNVVLLPVMPDSGGSPRRLAAGAGKDGNIYLVERNNAGKFSSSTNNIWQFVSAPLGGTEFGTGAVFNGTLYYGAVGANLKAFSFSNAKLNASPVATSALSFAYPGTTPSISSNGTGGGIVWATVNSTPARLLGYNATNLQVLFDSNGDSFGGGNKFITPTVANGKVYVGTMSSVGVFGILAGATTPQIVGPLTVAAAAGTPFRYQIAATNGPASFGVTGLPAWLAFNAQTGVMAGIPPASGPAILQISAINSGGTAAASLTINVGSGLPTPAARAFFRGGNGAINAITYPSGAIATAGGVFASDAASSQDAAGNAYVVARDSSGNVCLNVFNAISQSWGSWIFAGGAMQGNPGIAVSTAGVVYFGARDGSNGYWLNSYTPGKAVGGWVFLGGVFATDPVLAAASDGSIYLIAADAGGAIWSGRLVGSSFGGWVSGGGQARGRPSATGGSGGAVYVVMRDQSNAIWINGVQGNTWSTWSPGGGAASADPQVVAIPGTGDDFTVVLDSSGAVWYRPFEEGPSGGWQTWTPVGASMALVGPASTANGVFIAGKDNSGGLWWYTMSSGFWKYVGDNNAAVGALGTSPK